MENTFFGRIWSFKYVDIFEISIELIIILYNHIDKIQEEKHSMQICHFMGTYYNGAELKY
jgi:hypothetical protein